MKVITRPEPVANYDEKDEQTPSSLVAVTRDAVAAAKRYVQRGARP